MFRNKEIRQFMGWLAVITVLFGMAGFVISRSAGVLILINAGAFYVAFFAFTRARYSSIARISEQIDLILHNEEQLFISDSNEGELSILQSEITKMTLRIREQNLRLKKEKEHLADSLADIAHQLRTPLTSVNLILSLLENSLDEKERRRLLHEMEELLVRMEWLITALLKLSRLDAGIVSFKKERIDVNRLIFAALRPLQISFELHDITVKTDVPEGAEILRDLDWLSEAVQNIVKNCMESVGNYGQIEIICEDTLLYTEIAIRDTGRGFELEELANLFERFYRGKNSKTSGYGIGLALCKTVITRQGGVITAENHSKGGAIFRIRFPK